MNFKKLLFIFAVILTVFALVACTTQSTDNGNNNNQNTDNSADDSAGNNTDDNGNDSTDNNDNTGDNGNGDTGDNSGDNTPVYYTVSFDFNGISSQTVKSGEKATIPTAPSKDGYAFDGWMLGNELWSFDTPVTADITLTPSFTAIEYTITYIDGDMELELSPSTYTVETEHFALPNISKESHEFVGWYLDAEFTEPITVIPADSRGDITLYVKFTAITYTVSFDFDGISSQTVKSGEKATIPTAPSKDGYEFDGWMLGNELWSFDTPVTADITLTPSFTAIEYTITYMNGDKILSIKPESYTVESPDLELPTLNKEGHRFLGWYSDAEFTNKVEKIETGSTGNITLYAQYEIRSHAVTYESNGGVSGGNPESYTIFDFFTLLPAEKEYYIFDGWYTTETFDEGTKVESIDGSMMHKDITLYAKFSAVTYNITYVLGGGVNNEENPDSYTVEDSNFMFKAPTKEGYKFAGWFTNANYTYQISTLRDRHDDLTLYAKWDLIGSSGIITPEDTFN